MDGGESDYKHRLSLVRRKKTSFSVKGEREEGG